MQVSASNLNLLTVIPSHCIKRTFIGTLYAEKIAQAVLLYVFNSGFQVPSSGTQLVEDLDPYISQRTSLLRRLQGRPSPAKAPPIGRIHPFSKIAVTFEPLKGF